MNNNRHTNNLQNTSQNTLSALDALNQKLSTETSSIGSPPSNAKQTKKTKNIINKIKTKKTNTLNKELVLNKNIKNNPKQKTKVKPKKQTININKDNSEEEIESMNIKDLDEEIRKLEEELKNNKKIIETTITENKNEELKEEVDKNELKESKLALIKLLLGAKKNKEINDVEMISTSDISDNVVKNVYEEKFNIDDYDSENVQNNNIDIMNIEFNEQEGEKLIKVIEDEDSNYIVPQNVKIRSTNPNNSFVISRNNVSNFVKGSIYFDIDSENITSYDCYNDYMVNLEKKMRLSDLNIKSIDIPINTTENINNFNNELKIIINEKEQIFELEENYYNRYEIKDFLNEAFNLYNFDITCDIQDGIFVFTSNVKFTMLNHDKSILQILGFNKNAYINKNIYIAENPHQIGDNIYYLVIENISSKPLFYINKDTDEIKKLFDIEPYETDNLIIKFNKSPKDLIKNNKEYSYFFNKKHMITFELVI